MATKIKLNKGDSVWFAACKKPFKVRAANDRFAICTQPYNFKPKTVIYTIIDFERNVRGLDNMVLGIYSYYTDEECVAALQDFINGTMEVSYRTSKNVELDIIKVKRYENKEYWFKLRRSNTGSIHNPKTNTSY